MQEYETNRRAQNVTQTTEGWSRMERAVPTSRDTLPVLLDTAGVLYGAEKVLILTVESNPSDDEGCRKTFNSVSIQTC